MKPLKKHENPYHPVEYLAKHASAVQMLEQGECPPHLQKEFLDWLVDIACGTYDQSFRTDTHLTAFAEGRRFVGNTVIKMLKLEPGQLRKLEESEK